MRFNEVVNQNKELKNTSRLMERKVDELTEECGTLSSQVGTCINAYVLNHTIPFYL